MEELQFIVNKFFFMVEHENNSNPTNYCVCPSLNLS